MSCFKWLREILGLSRAGGLSWLRCQWVKRDCVLRVWHKVAGMEEADCCCL